MAQTRKGRREQVLAEREEARRLTVLLGQVNSALYRARQEELRPLGIPMMHSAVLWVLRVANTTVTPAEISRKIFRRHQSILELLSRMERQGYITVQRGPRKGGPVKVAMTGKGREAVDLAWEREMVVAEILSTLSEDERETFRVYLERIRDRASAVQSRSMFEGQFAGLEEA